MELSKTKTGIYASLGSKKMRERHGLFVVEGRKGVEDTLGRFEAECVITLSGTPAPAGLSASVACYEVSERELRRLSSLSTPSDLMAVYRIPQDGGFSEPEEGSLSLLLDGVQDPGNLGTIIRTAHWFGIKRIYASRDTADLYNPKTVQSTMGSLGRVEVIYTDLEEVVKMNPDLPVYGTLLDGENIYEATLSEHGFIVMGNEGKGISAALRALITRGLYIPPGDSSDCPESLNVAIATAVTLSQFRSAAAGKHRGNA